ncbi:neutral metalloprotease [Staphylococcus agnetis]|uniref:M30 family zinc metallopeptidase n=1 Tax=Staphylococcus agnetis TaxID=985762 RepID=UPI00208FA57C|nr:neutral metalloprotease [Staphylococcus agnetis]MCO4346161.1 neutral metalloprotease [Staphylococcus agnetis]MCO4355683.1 neutral metalloprotease [Staphylococcus agnetis]MCO4360425.1 neutral metalloprotease [Staphylococcus agnetis]MCO4364896.1 neutral metalloprotease [Staphylococcus agnetis]MCO4372169.1 neutral metalloprotease [Staphylococcus agnetis]
MINKKKLITSLVTSSLLATFTLGSFADAHTYIINNEDINKNSQESSIGTLKQNNFKQSTIDSMKPKSLQSFQEDKVFKAPKEKTPITERTRKSEQSLSNSKLDDVRSFTTVNMRTNANERTAAKLKYNGKNTNVWVADNYITDKQAKNIGEEFDNKIDPLVKEKFGEPSDVDHDGKVNILVYDIKDDFETTGSYTGGYFHPRDLYDVPHSNKAEVFYMDTYPSMGTDKNNLNEKKVYSTLAHEYQHMVNANQKLLKEQKEDGMDVWLDEAFAMASEHMYLQKPLDHRIEYYNNSTSIANGHSLIKWNHRGDVLSNYALSYLFSQYLSAQSDNGDKIFKEILQDPADTSEALENAIHKHVDPKMSLGEFMTNFRVALKKKEATGLHGFKGEPGFNSISPKPVRELPQTLAPQGSVMFETTSPIQIPKDKDENVEYVKVK